MFMAALIKREVGVKSEKISLDEECLKMDSSGSSRSPGELENDKTDGKH